MKIAVSCRNGTMEEPVDERFGRCRKFLIYDTETRETSVVDNSMNMDSPGGAGIQTAQNVSKAGAGAVISGHLGPKAASTLRAADIKAYSAPGKTVAEAIELYREEKLTKLADADVQGHW